MAHIPAELDSVEIEGVVATITAHGGRTGKSVADFGFLKVTVLVHECAMGCSHDDDRDVFIKMSMEREVDILVPCVGGVKVAVKIAGVVHVYVAVDFDVCGERCGGRYHSQGQNQFAHISFQ